MDTPRALVVFSVVLVVVVAGSAGALGGGTDAQSEVQPGPHAVSETPNLTAAGANGTLEVHYINVGQGSSILVVAPNNETLLVDTGDWRDDGRHVLQYLQAQNVTRVDHLVTSHADADHIGGHAAVIDYYETEADGVGAVYDPGLTAASQTYDRYLDAVEEHDVPLYRVAANDTIPFAGVETAVLSPPEDYLAGGERNENSVVLAVEHGGHEFLFPGDGEARAESYLVDTYNSTLDSTALAAGHHGSRTSTSARFLDATKPRVVVVSSAYDSRYGHPHNETLRRLANRSIPTYWTATHGTVVLGSDGRNLTVSTQRVAPTNATELRNAPPVEPGTTDDVTLRRTIVAGNDSESNDTTSETPRAVTETETGTESPEATPTATPTPTPTATPTPTPTATPTPTPTATEESAAAGSLSLVRVHADAEGDEWDNLNDEYLVFENTGDAALDLSGWTVRDEAGHTYRFPTGSTLAAGASVTLHTGTGDDTEADRYWDAGAPVWNNDGDTVVVTDDDGTVVLEHEYQ